MGISLGGMFKSVLNPMTLAQLAMGPAGWASIIAKAVISAVAQQVIQKVGEQLGLPQGMINIAQQAFSAASGGAGASGVGGSALGGILGGGNSLSRAASAADVVRGFAQELNLNARQEGELTRAANDFQDSVTQLAQNLAKEMAEKNKADVKRQTGDGDKDGLSKKGNFLQRMAQALGAMADQKMDDMDKLSDAIAKQIHEGESITDKIGKLDKKDNKALQQNTQQFQNNQNKLGSLNSMMQATAQELGILQNVISTVLKSVGEAQSTLARKT